jgi:hypothetical protein
VADDDKSLEMRIAAIEDKLAQMLVTEEEMQAYQKVAGMMGAPAQAPVQPQAGCVANCVVQCINECLIRQCTIVRQCTISQCTIFQCTIIRQCTYECIGPCAPGGGQAGGGGFGGFGGLGG